MARGNAGRGAGMRGLVRVQAVDAVVNGVEIGRILDILARVGRHKAGGDHEGVLVRVTGRGPDTGLIAAQTFISNEIGDGDEGHGAVSAHARLWTRQMGADMFCGCRIWRQATLFLDAEISYDTIIFYLISGDT